MTRRLTEHSVLPFDCYGTLIDWETGIWDALQPLFAANPPADPSRRHALDAFDRFEAAQQIVDLNRCAETLDLVLGFARLPLLLRPLETFFDCQTLFGSFTFSVPDS